MTKESVVQKAKRERLERQEQRIAHAELSRKQAACQRIIKWHVHRKRAKQGMNMITHLWDGMTGYHDPNSIPITSLDQNHNSILHSPSSTVLDEIKVHADAHAAQLVVDPAPHDMLQLIGLLNLFYTSRHTHRLSKWI